jgi:hypothetical protein
MRTPYAPRRSHAGVSAVSVAVLEWLEDRRLLSSVAGIVYNDLDGDGTRDAGEAALQGWTVYLDQNRNHTRDAGETFTQTLADGATVSRTSRRARNYIGQEIPTGWEQTSPGAAGTISGFATVPVRPRPTSPAPPPIRSPSSIRREWSTTTTASTAPALPEGEETQVVPADAQSNALINLNSFRADSRFTGVDGDGYSVAVLDTAST